MKSNLKRQSYVVIAVVLAIAIGYPVCAFFPKMRAIARVRQEIRQKQDFVTETEKRRPLISQQQAALASTFKYLDMQRSRLVAPDKLSAVFGTISKLAKDAGTTTTRFQPHAPVAYDTFRKIPIDLGVTGRTDAIETFLSQIEHLPYTMWLDELKMDVAGDDGQTTRCNVELAIFVDNPEISN